MKKEERRKKKEERKKERKREKRKRRGVSDALQELICGAFFLSLHDAVPALVTKLRPMY